jgi:hypothetical protein
VLSRLTGRLCLRENLAISDLRFHGCPPRIGYHSRERNKDVPVLLVRHS